MKVAVVVFPGSNCDRDCAWAVGECLSAPVELVWHGADDLGGADLVILPGGFSYGDYLRTGAIASRSPVMAAVRRHAGRGGPVLGICNGFQILCEAGLLPGALAANASGRFVCRDVHVRVVSDRTPFTRQLGGRVLRLPVAHQAGAYWADQETLTHLEEAGQVVFRYCTADGRPGDNPNGSLADIAGVANTAGNVVGLMPHPERAASVLLGSVDGLAILGAALGAAPVPV